jgi:hypothetical protein
MCRIVVLVKRYSDDPASKDVILLVRTASVDMAKSSAKMIMRICLFIPSDGMAAQKDVDDGDNTYGWR